MITAADGVAPVNNFAHSLFQNLTIEMAGRTVTDSSNYYAYRAYLQRLLRHSHSALVLQMTSSLFYLDTAAAFNDIAQSGLNILQAMANNEKLPLPRSAYESLALPVARELLKYKDPRAPKRILYKSFAFLPQKGWVL